MSVRISVKGDSRAVRRDLRKLQKRDQPKAESAALNRTAQKIRTRGVRRLARSLQVPQKSIRRRVRMGKASPRKPEVRMRVFVQPIPLLSTAKGRQTTRGVRAGRRSVAGAFIQSPYGKRVAFKRRGKARYPIDAVKIQVEPKGSSTFDRLVRRLGRTIFRREFDRQARRFIARGRRGR